MKVSMQILYVEYIDVELDESQSIKENTKQLSELFRNKDLELYSARLLDEEGEEIL